MCGNTVSITILWRSKVKTRDFQAIGDIETALNNEISYILGEKDPYLYLDFEKWC